MVIKKPLYSLQIFLSMVFSVYTINFKFYSEYKGAIFYIFNSIIMIILIVILTLVNYNLEVKNAN